MSKKFKALILAAGYGTRLKPYTDDLPKCLMKVGGKPILGFWLDHLDKIGCEEVLVNTHYLSEKVEEYINSLHYENMKITTTFEQKLLGTAKTLIKNIDFFENQDALLMHSDNFSFVNLKSVLKAHQMREKNTLLTMLTFTSKKPSSCGVIVSNSRGVMTSFYEKVRNPPSTCANGAIYVLSNQFFDWILKNKQDAVDFSVDIIPYLGGKVQTCHTNHPFIDIGTPESYIDANSLAEKFSLNK